MNKLYIRIQYSIEKHTIIRVDNIKEFQKYINDPGFLAHIKFIVVSIKLGKEIDRKPYEINISQNEFDLLTREIKSKISSMWKRDMYFRTLSIVQDSNHFPLLLIKPIEVVKEKEIVEK